MDQVIVQRRVFQAKVGQAGAVVAKLKESGILFKGADWWPTGRVYSDYHSGATDRVVWEIEIESLSAFEDLMNAIGADVSFAPWFGELSTLVEGATVEFWNIES
jgi:hypothetical protein